MTKTCWRIYTEYIHTRHIVKIVDKYFADYFMFSGIEHNGGDKRRCLVIEITDHDEKGKDIVNICQEINTDNQQIYCTVTTKQIFTMKFYLKTMGA